jgi:hypothetical protein
MSDAWHKGWKDGYNGYKILVQYEYSSPEYSDYMLGYQSGSRDAWYDENMDGEEYE